MFQSQFVTESYFSPGFEIHIVQFYIYVCVYIYIYIYTHNDINIYIVLKSILTTILICY